MCPEMTTMPKRDTSCYRMQNAQTAQRRRHAFLGLAPTFDAPIHSSGPHPLLSTTQCLLHILSSAQLQLQRDRIPIRALVLIFKSSNIRIFDPFAFDAPHPSIQVLCQNPPALKSRAQTTPVGMQSSVSSHHCSHLSCLTHNDGQCRTSYSFT